MMRNHMMSFLTNCCCHKSRNPTTNNAAKDFVNPRQQATLPSYVGKVTMQPVSGKTELTLFLLDTTEKYTQVQVEATRGNNGLSSVTIAKGRVILPSSVLSPRGKGMKHGSMIKNGSDALTEVHNPDNLNYDLFNQSEQIMTSSEQSNDVSQTETKITSDSNIIPYSQYLSETQQETVQNSNSSAQQDVLILSMFEQLNTQVTHCTNVNKALTTELDRYKGEVKDLKEMQNVENSFSGSNEQYAEIEKGVRLSTSASGSQPSGNTRNDRILQTPSSNSKNKVEAHPRNVKSSLNKRNGTVKINGSASVQNSKKHDNSDYVCINGDDCMSSANLLPSRKPIVLDSESPKPVVKLVYSRKPRKNKNTVSVSKTKDCPHRPLLQNNGFMETIRLGMLLFQGFITFKDYGHNLFLWDNSCDSNLEVAFRQHTCFIRNLEGVDLLMGSRGDNLYTLSLGNMMASSPICLLSKASKTKSWLWHHVYPLELWQKFKETPQTPNLRTTNQKNLYLFAYGSVWANACRECQWKEMIQVQLKETVRRIRTDNGTEFVNQTLRE
ncbi:hypothetical protein Tco_1110434 [Tanacetum coccineum]|uniref:Integrase, catalytic region, zinc finger, CCHC-type, peptidase aspartic, catalytic n=1 Tax=Tanacetum coccineum TaxID=301880 RepID=A0ABQ5IJZ4_9ASTR